MKNIEKNKQEKKYIKQLKTQALHIINEAYDREPDDTSSMLKNDVYQNGANWIIVHRYEILPYTNTYTDIKLWKDIIINKNDKQYILNNYQVMSQKYSTMKHNFWKTIQLEKNKKIQNKLLKYYNNTFITT